MENVFAILVLFFLLASFWYLARWIFGKKENKKRFRNRFGISVLVMLVATGIFGNLEGNRLSEQATQLGFDSVDEYKAAQSAGISDPNEWAVRKADIQADAARAAEAQAALDAEREAEAAQAAAIAEQEAAARDAFFAAPETQIAFVAAAQAAQQAHKNAENDLQKGAARRERMRSQCSAVPNGIARGWSGEITQLTTNTEGKAIFEVELASGIRVKTWNNGLSDIGDRTMIDPDSALFGQLINLSQGDQVRFDGRLVSDSQKIDCFKEPSLTLDGSLRAPEYIIRFERVETFSE